MSFVGKDFRPLLRDLRAAGCAVEGHNGHVKVYKDGRLVGTMAGSPSSTSGHKKARAHFKRLGIIP